MGIKVNLSGVRTKVSPEAMRRGRYALGNQAMADMNQFVPRKNNSLRQSAHLSSEGEKIIWYKICETPILSKWKKIYYAWDWTTVGFKSKRCLYEFVGTCLFERSGY